MKHVLRVINVLATVVILVAFVVLLRTVFTPAGEIPTIMGYGFMRTLTGSMEPAIPVHSFIVVDTDNSQAYQVGDIITFHSSDDVLEGSLNTHRIAAIDEINGMRSFTTKGDNNDVADSHIISDGDIVGKYVFALPQMGKVMDFLSSSMGFLIVIVLPMLLFFIYQVYHLIVVGMNLKRAMAEEDRLAAAAAIVDAEGKGDTAAVTADNAAEQLAQAEAKLEEARRLKAEAEAAMSATKQEDTDGE